MQDDAKAALLTGIARAAVAERLGLSFPGPDTTGPAWLHEPAATFVTLTMHGRLRGCIGSLEAVRPLLDDLRANAAAAALSDPRFPPLSADEFDAVRFEVSLLSPLEPIPVTTEGEVIGSLRPGIDGIVLHYGVHRATFLPQVWEQLPEPNLFLAQLKLKAGLPADFWHEELLVFRYEVSKFREATATE